MIMDRQTVMNGTAGMAAVFIVSLIIAAIVPVKTAETYSEAITISCYMGNPENDNYIGDLTVPDPENAGQSCNALYSDCQGECSGCFADSDITEDICYDKMGKKFLQ
jgi:hypothetical protein